MEDTKSMISTKKDLSKSQLTMRKLKRILEASSVVCATASISMVIACQYRIIPEFLGFKSYEIVFDLAFSLLVASISLSVLGMATSRIQDRKLDISVSALRLSTIFSSLLTSFLSFKNKNISRCEKYSKATDVPPALNYAECIKNLNEIRSNQENSCSLDNVSLTYSKNAKSSVFPTSSDKSSEINSLAELQKCHTPFSFGHCGISHSPIHLTERSNFMEFDLQQTEKESQLSPLFQRTFTTNGHFNEVNARYTSGKRPQVGIVSPIKIGSTDDVKSFNLYEQISPSAVNIRACQKHSNKMFNPKSSLEQQSFYQDTGRLSNPGSEVNDTILYDCTAPIKSFHKFPSSQQKVFYNRLQITHLQNFNEMQNKLPRVCSRDSREIPHPELLQTIPESSDDFTNIRSEMKNFNFHKIQEIDSGDCYKLHRKVNPSFESFQPSLKDVKEASHSQIGMINSFYEWDLNSGWRRNFAESPEMAMEICDKPSDEEVLEVSTKLNDLNFIF